MDTIPKVIANHFPGLGIVCNKSDWYWTLPNGSEIWIGGLDDGARVDKILGKEFCTIYINEASEVDYDAFSTVKTRLAQRCEQSDGTLLRNVIYLDENPSSVKHWTYVRYVLGLDPESKAKLSDEDVARFGVGNITPQDNVSNMAPQFLRMLEGLPRAKRMRYLLGKFSADTEGALWKSAWIDDHRVSAFDWHRLGRIVVGVDPAVTSKKKSDHTGIIVAGILDAEPSHFYVLEDASGKYTPLEWGRKALSLYMQYGADCIVGESNQGGDLVESNLHNIDEFAQVKLVRATRGKWIRAEPVSGLYERGLVHHVGMFPDMEAEMTTWKPDDADSPDRMDALVWAVTELSGNSMVTFSMIGQGAPVDPHQAAFDAETRLAAPDCSKSEQPQLQSPAGGGLDDWSSGILHALDGI
jgi:phage terminase large subunit-like protein